MNRNYVGRVLRDCRREWILPSARYRSIANDFISPSSKMRISDTHSHTHTGALVPAPSTQGGRGMRGSEAASAPFVEIPLAPYLRNGGKRKVEITLMFARLVEIRLSPPRRSLPRPVIFAWMLCPHYRAQYTRLENENER